MALTEEQKKHILHPNFGGSSSSQGSDVLVMPAEHITAKAPTGAELVVDSFAFDKATIPSAKLNDLKALRTRLSAAPGSTVRLIGHTDTVGTEQYNVKLGLARAVAVRDFLVAEKSVTPSAIKIESKGETTPARGEPPAKRDPDKGEEDPKNRRVEIFVVWSNGSSNSLRGSDVLVFPPDHITAGKPNGSNSGKGSGQGSGGTGGGGGGSEKGAGNGTAGKPGVPPATPQRGGGIRLPKVTLNIGVDLPEVPLGDFKVGGRLEYQVTLGLAQESGGVEGELKFKNLSKPEYSVKVKEKIAGGAKLTGGGKVSSDKGSLGVGVEFASDASPNRKHSLEFSPAQVDKGKLKVGVLDWKETVPLKDGTFEIDGIKVDYSGSFVVTVSGTPDWVKIGQQVAERYGVDVAANAAVGGTGAAGALAVAAAPAAGIAGGIVGGLALTTGVMYLIGSLEAQGRDATDICVEGARQLRDYAKSYGSMMRGQAGSNEQGNQDAEVRLRAMMKASPGMTPQQAVEVAKQSKLNFENMAYRELLPAMRIKVKEAYDKAHPWASDNTFNTVLSEVLDENSHY